MAKARLNLAAIEESLLEVQSDFKKINQTLIEPRSPMTDRVRCNMMEGYRCIDQLLDSEVNLYEPGNSSWLLELNTLVLCGSSKKVRRENRGHIDATRKNLFERQIGEIEDLLDWLQRHSEETSWKRAAAIFIHILSQPQLYLEGNHRTGALIMSFFLTREGKPPFVLSVDNAKAFFDPSTLAKETNKYGMIALFKLPKLKGRFAKLLEKNSQNRFLFR